MCENNNNTQGMKEEQIKATLIDIPLSEFSLYQIHPSWICPSLPAQWLCPWAAGTRPHAGRPHLRPVLTGEWKQGRADWFPMLCYYVLVTIYWLFAAEPWSGITRGFGWRYWETVHSKTPIPTVLRDCTEMIEVERETEIYVWLTQCY